MLEINKRKVKLCLFDTNILSEVVKNKKPYFKKLFELYPPPEYIFCYSVFSITEVKKSNYLLEKYIDTFSVLPSFIMNGHEEIFREELKHYLNRKHKIKAWAIIPFAIKSKLQISSTDKLRYVLNDDYVVSKEKYWLSRINDILNGIVGLEKNFPSKGHKYTKSEILEFMNIVTTEQIILGARDFVKNALDSGKTIDIELFPSVKSTIYTVFYKFYPDKRKPVKSDVFDIIISSLLPYVDVFITEGHQNEVINKMKKVDNFLNHLKNISIKEIV